MRWRPYTSKGTFALTQKHGSSGRNKLILDRNFLLKMTAKAQPLKAESLTVDHKPLHVPDLEEAAKGKGPI